MFLYIVTFMKMEDLSVHWLKNKQFLVLDTIDSKFLFDVWPTQFLDFTSSLALLMLLL
jgi:hypothetical protein